MSIVLIFNYKDPKPWAETLKKQLPDAAIHIYPDVGDPDLIRFAICWKPTNYVLNEFPNLKVIQSAGAGVDHILRTQTLRPDQILTRIVDDNLTHDMWEFLLAAVLSNIKKLQFYAQEQSAKNWSPTPYQTFKSTTVSILGLGQIGAFVAAQFAALGIVVKGWSQSEKHIPNVQSFAGEDGFNAALKDADFLINLLPLTSETENILNKNTLKKAKTGSFLINVGRGEHLVEADLIQLLDDNHLSGAMLDVFRAEPLPMEHPFWAHPKIQLTPHIASITNFESATEQMAQNYRAFIAGNALQNVVSHEKGY
jgi:glyoxylate/hydroxypyruvate reductase